MTGLTPHIARDLVTASPEPLCLFFIFFFSDDWHSNKTIRRYQMPYILYTCEVRPDGRGVSVGCFIIMHLKFSSCARLAAQGWRLFLLVDLVTVCEISWVFPSLIGLQLSQNGYNL